MSEGVDTATQAGYTVGYLDGQESIVDELLEFIELTGMEHEYRGIVKILEEKKKYLESV